MESKQRPRAMRLAVFGVLVAACTAGPAATVANPASANPASANPAAPTASAVPSMGPTQAGVALRSAFEPAFELLYLPSEWNVFDDNQLRDVFLQYVPTQEALQFITLDNVPAVPCDASSEPAAVFPTVPWSGTQAADFIRWLKMAAGSALEVSAPVPVTLGGASGLQADISGTGARDCNFVRISMWADDNSLRISTTDPPSRVVVLEVGPQTVLIWFHGDRQSFGPIAAQLLSTLEFK